MGIDGCRAGWVLARSDETLSHVVFEIQSTFQDAVAELSDDDRAIIDIPIGLMDCGPRSCDSAARLLLLRPRRPRRSSSVFPAPCRGVLHAKAQTAKCSGCGKGLTQQLFVILPKIGEVDTLMTANLQVRVREAHPEVTFAVLSGQGYGLKSRKKRVEGREERESILKNYLLGEFNLSAERKRLGTKNIELDELIDALACLATAHRWSKGSAKVLPRDAECRDSRGLRMEMVA